MDQLADFLTILTSLIVIWEFIIKKIQFVPFKGTKPNGKSLISFTFASHSLLKKIHGRCIFATSYRVSATAYCIYATIEVVKKNPFI